MTVQEALKAAIQRAGWSATKLAAEAEVTEAAARRWLNGSAEPRLSQYRLLRERLPGFAELIDGAAVA